MVELVVKTSERVQQRLEAEGSGQEGLFEESNDDSYFWELFKDILTGTAVAAVPILLG